MGDSTFNFCINNPLNPNFDITWSIQYNISGEVNATGGFSTFLFKNSSLVGGGRYSGLGYAPYYSDIGVVGSLIGIMFDTTNFITIKDSNFNNIYHGNIFNELKPFISQDNRFNTIRFNLTNSAQNLIISIKDSNNNYIDVLNIKTNIVLTNIADTYKIGFGYSSPLNAMEKKIAFSIKDLHVQGSGKLPKILYNNNNTKSTDYILQSPYGDKINIAIKGVNSGSLVH